MSSHLVELVLLSVIGLLISQHHCGLSGSFGVVVPDGSLINGILLLLEIVLGILILPIVAALAENDVALVVVGIEG